MVRWDIVIKDEEKDGCYRLTRDDTAGLQVSVETADDLERITEIILEVEKILEQKPIEMPKYSN